MKNKWCILLLLLLIPFLGSSQEPQLSFFSFKNVYLYSMGTWIFDVPPGYYPEGTYVNTANSFGNIGGIGYTVFNYKDRAFIHLEFDYMSAEFDFSSDLTREVEFACFMANLEYRFSRTLPVTIFLGFGFGDVRYSGLYKHYRPGDPFVYYKENDYRGFTSLGLKVSVTKRLAIRTELRYCWENTGDYGYPGHQYGYGEYDWNAQKFAAMFGLGVEYRFRSR